MDSCYRPLQLARQFPTLQRLEKDRFHWLRQGGAAEIQITGRQLNWLLDGYNLAAMKGHNKLHFSSIV
ncbi:hypothetical protein Mmc1_1985 [Magnetococcus marinus MC-1]|uniref:Transposase n=1 Tax=Magnetococcus marinus (strain ATCC BAA-1437 / JCM 17883 / MC-1) TaxID=156889 RepID=A0L944_MAGMM|nr:IS66 family insertion sequence element accessory protein TnpB [Magnetococcus marinus]ABK44487.1 hypothetical protein Mmc1_1985 [Magnetococcus marinus MC-1]